MVKKNLDVISRKSLQSELFPETKENFNTKISDTIANFTKDLLGKVKGICLIAGL